MIWSWWWQQLTFVEYLIRLKTLGKLISRAVGGLWHTGNLISWYCWSCCWEEGVETELMIIKEIRSPLSIEGNRKRRLSTWWDSCNLKTWLSSKSENLTIWLFPVFHFFSFSLLTSVIWVLELMNLFSLSLNFPFILSSFLNLNCILPEWKENPLATPQLSDSLLQLCYLFYFNNYVFSFSRFLISLSFLWISFSWVYFITFYTYFNLEILIILNISTILVFKKG